MVLKVVGLHHHAVRLAPGPDAAAAVRRFYAEVLGLESDVAARDRPDDGLRINAGGSAQIHLVPQPAHQPPPGSFDPAAPHVALAVGCIDDAQAELDRLAVPYRVVHGRLGPDSRRLFLTDPAGNLVELHQQDRCRCTARARSGLGQARVCGTVLFADMRGFTAVAERLAPAEVVPLLNEYFSLLSDVTAEHGGSVFHMAGDGLMAGFGLPDPADDASERAVAAARRMIAGFGRMADDWKARLGLETGLGIGINAGDVIVGDVGAPERPNYTLIGDTVNVAARLVQRARAGEALLSRAVREALDPATGGIVELPPLVLRGRSRPVELYCMAAESRLDLRPAAA
ncbi:MAG: VOC family protein [Steroidobacteraceae bacterium]|nr:VOC family protein [Steroidobacteraceae bacterium]